MKSPPLIAAAILLAALAGLALMALPGTPQAQTGPTLSVDTDPAASPANTASSVGSIEPCRSVPSGSGSFDVDITIQGVTSLSGFQADLFYNPTVLTVTGMGSAFMLASTGILFNLSEPVPDSDGTFKILLATTGQASGDGVITRLTLQPVADGTSLLDLANVKLRDFDGNPVQPSDVNGFYTGPVADGTISVGAPCAADSDLDGVPDASDNCPSTSNPDQTNTDAALGAAGATIGGVPIGDALGDACDDDDDDDGTSDTIEGYVGSNPLDNCGVNTWPPDMFDNNQVVDNLDIIPIVAAWLTADPDPAYNRRADIFDGNGIIDNLDIIPIAAYWLKDCT